MDHFNIQNGQLYIEGVAVADIAAEFSTPCYIYSRAAFEQHWHDFNDAFGEHPHMICYSLKANSNLAVVNLLARLGSGFDIVSIGELERVLAAKGDPKKVVFSGVGKQAHEIKRALEVGIYCFNVESDTELERLNTIAQQLNCKAPIALRINPDIDAKTHPYISTGLKENKFGIDIHEAKALYLKAQQYDHIDIIGIDCHIGSQLLEIEPLLAALDRLLTLTDELQSVGINIKTLDLGGGLGVRYHQEQPPQPQEYALAIKEKLKQRKLQIILEPGRAIAANAGLLVTQVEYLKHKQSTNFAIVDAAMNDLLRPALYQAWQEIIPVIHRQQGKTTCYDVVGPICESGDILGKQRHLNLQVGDLLAIHGAGAYGFGMSSNYNTRPRAAEVMVDGQHTHLIRSRETIAELYAQEQLLP
ncbi:MAG: diaminopimelate decarboxylase [Gammaproteobacteria bacterium]